MQARFPKEKITIVGAGILGAFEAYAAYLDAKQQGKDLRITIYEKNNDIYGTTAANVFPSLTPDESLSVVPRGAELAQKSKIPFNEPGGIRVDVVPDVNNTLATQQFIASVEKYGQDELGHRQRTESLLAMGKVGMDLWQSFYEQADAELKQILIDANFNPCREPTHPEQRSLHDGYRVDLIYNMPNAANKAAAMQTAYQSLGYNYCQILSPTEVRALDPHLSHFCETHSDQANTWHNDTVAIWRPGGCIDTRVFLPKFFAYLQKNMGEYIDEQGQVKSCLQLRFGREVSAVVYNDNQDEISGLKFQGQSTIKTNHRNYLQSDYIFCPGEAVGTLKKFGMQEPSYAGFAGASLRLTLPLPENLQEKYHDFNHCMEVHQEGVVLAWQARRCDTNLTIGVAGTKAYYADQKPDKDQAFAKNRNLLQLNMINDVLPEIMSLALGRDTHHQVLTASDLEYLEAKQIAQRWVGTRAVAYDGYPTLGPGYHENKKIKNSQISTQCGSGGVSLARASVFFSRKAMAATPDSDPLTQAVVHFSDSRRRI